MLREKVISCNIEISGKNPVVNFTIPLPHGATKIVAIEHGVRVTTPLPAAYLAEDFAGSFTLKPARTFGHLRLQHPGCSGLFYATAISQGDSMNGFADFSATPGLPPQGFSHGFKRLEDITDIPKQAKNITGIYRHTSGNIAYSLLVHVWVATGKECEA